MKSSISDQQNREIEKIIEQMSKPEKVVMLDQTAAVLQESTQTCVDIIKMKQKQHCRKLQPQIKPTSK